MKDMEFLDFLGKSRQAHAVAWILHNIKDVPEGMIMRHVSCPLKNKLCVNPKHLEIGNKTVKMKLDTHFVVPKVLTQKYPKRLQRKLSIVGNVDKVRQKRATSI